MEQIVTANGCFDGLHPGHIRFLKEAKEQGDKLIVLLNSDSSILEIKKRKPLHTEKDRKEMLEALSVVDEVRIFTEATPIEALKKIKPNIHVNGEEYGLNCIESKIAKIHLVKRYKDYSSSKVKEISKEIKSKTIAIDFDRVIHRYSKGWQGMDNAYDPPMVGAIESIKKFYGLGFRLIIFTSRAVPIVKEWLIKYNLLDYFDLVTNTKVPAKIYIDDRGFRFINWRKDTNKILKILKKEENKKNET